MAQETEARKQEEEAEQALKEAKKKAKEEREKRYLYPSQTFHVVKRSLSIVNRRYIAPALSEASP